MRWVQLVVWAFFGIAFLWDFFGNDLFQSCGPLNLLRIQYPALNQLLHRNLLIPLGLSSYIDILKIWLGYETLNRLAPMWKHPSPHSGAIHSWSLSYGYDVSLVLFTFWAAIPVHLPGDCHLDLHTSWYPIQVLFAMMPFFSPCLGSDAHVIACPVPYRFWYPVLTRTPFSSCMASDCLTTVLLCLAVPNGFWTKCSGRERKEKEKENKKKKPLLYFECCHFDHSQKAHSKVASSFETFRHLN